MPARKFRTRTHAYDILIVDDEPDIRSLVAGILRDEGFETRARRNTAGAIAAFRARRPGLVLQDVWLQGSKLDGLQLLEMFHGEEPQVPVVMISGHGTIETAVQAIQKAPTTSSKSRSSPTGCCWS